MLKSSKSYPEDFLRRNEADMRIEDGDNSSSGVSSDQEAHSNTNSEYPERTANELPSSKKHHTGRYLSFRHFGCSVGIFYGIK